MPTLHTWRHLRRRVWPLPPTDRFICSQFCLIGPFGGFDFGWKLTCVVYPTLEKPQLMVVSLPFENNLKNRWLLKSLRTLLKQKESSFSSACHWWHAFWVWCI